MIRFDNVGLRYGSGPEILRDVTFHVHPGSFHFLTGPSGAGKTSLLRLLFMSLRPSRGLIFVFGENLADLPPAGRAALRRRIGIVFQDFRLLDHLTTWLEERELAVERVHTVHDGRRHARVAHLLLRRKARSE